MKGGEGKTRTRREEGVHVDSKGKPDMTLPHGSLGPTTLAVTATEGDRLFLAWDLAWGGQRPRGLWEREDE